MAPHSGSLHVTVVSQCAPAAAPYTIDGESRPLTRLPGVEKPQPSGMPQAVLGAGSLGSSERHALPSGQLTSRTFATSPTGGTRRRRHEVKPLWGGRVNRRMVVPYNCFRPAAALAC